MPHCLLLMTQLTTDFISISPLREVTMVQTEKSHNVLLYEHKSTSSKQKASAPYLLSSSHKARCRQKPALPYQMLLWCTEEGEFSVSACMHSLHIIRCDASSHCPVQENEASWQKWHVTNLPETSCWRRQITKKTQNKNAAMAYSHQFWSLLKYSTAN